MRIWNPRGSSVDVSLEQRIFDYLVSFRVNFEYDVLDLLAKKRGYHVVDVWWNAIIVGHHSSVLVESAKNMYDCKGKTMVRSILLIDSATDYTIYVTGESAHVVRLMPRF